MGRIAAIKELIKKAGMIDEKIAPREYTPSE
jgi:hypothetical protein